MNETLRFLFKKGRKGDGSDSPGSESGKPKEEEEETEGEEDNQKSLSTSLRGKKRSQEEPVLRRYNSGSERFKKKCERPISMKVDNSGSGGSFGEAEFSGWKSHFQDKLQMIEKGQNPMKMKRRKYKTLKGRPRSLTLNQASFLRKKKNVEKKETGADDMFKSPSKMLGNFDQYEIHQVAFEGDVRKLYDLVKINRDLNSPNADANTPLHFSSARGKILCVKELLKHPDVDTIFPNRSGETPLHIASKKGHADLVKLMIRNGRCNMEERDRYGKTCVELSSSNRLKKVFLKQQRKEAKFLQYVADKNFEKVFKYLKKKGVNVNCTREIEVSEGKVKKMNALGILFNTKRLSELEEHGDLIRLLVNRGCEVSKEISSFESTYQDLLSEGYLRGKRYNFLREVLQTEKVYNDDLWITINLFWWPLKEGTRGNEKTIRIFKNIKKEGFQDHLRKFWVTFEEIRKVALKNAAKLRKTFEDFRSLIDHTEGAAHPNRSEELAQAEHKFVASLSDTNLEPYIRFCYQQTYMEGWIRKKREYSEVIKFYKKQEQNIPLPRIRDGGFVSMLSKVRNRLFKYRGFLECLLKYTDSGRSDDYIEILRQVLKHIMDGLDQINKDAGDVENKKQMIEIHNLFKERYNIKMLVQNQDRRYICHETNFLAFNMESQEVQLCDIYVFSDSVFFGSKRRGGGFEFYWYNQRKMIWTWHDDHYRLMIFQMRKDGGEKILDYIVPCTYGYTWFKEMKEFFTKHHPTFYWNHVFLHSAFTFDKEMEEFRLLRSEDDELKVHRRMMIKYKNKMKDAEEKAMKYMNKIIEKKKTIEKMRRKMKKMEKEMRKLKFDMNKEILTKKGSLQNNESIKQKDEEGETKAMKLPFPKIVPERKKRIKKIDLKIKFAMEPVQKKPKKHSPESDENNASEEKKKRKIFMHMAEDETPVKVPYHVNQNIFDSFPGGGDEEEDDENEENKLDFDAFNGLFAENPHALRLFTTPTATDEEQ